MKLIFKLIMENQFGKNVWKLVKNLISHHMEPKQCTYLRAEKGFIIVGQDTDGTMTPIDLQMDWIVSKKKYDFIGKRSLYRSDTMKRRSKTIGWIIN